MHGHMAVYSISVSFLENGLRQMDLFINSLQIVYKDYLVDQKWLDENQIVYAVIGVDFGGTKSAHSFTLTGFTKGFEQVVVLDEYYCKKRINPKQLQDDFIDFVRRAQSRVQDI